MAEHVEGDVRYMRGFGNHFSTEAVAGSLPKFQNTPKECPNGLYAEQLSGTAFTAPRHANKRTWLYRKVPSAVHTPYAPYAGAADVVGNFAACRVDPTQLRWRPFELPAEGAKVDFVDGLHTLCGAGSAEMRSGLGVHVYACNSSMEQRAFYNSDGEMLFVPEKGVLDVQTEMGRLVVAPGEICVIPRGVVFQVRCPDGATRGYVLEVFSGSFEIPDLGPIGANGLANPRDFLAPVASFVDTGDAAWHVVGKFAGSLFVREQKVSPFNVVAWHGNFNPYKYDLANFCVINSVSYEHIDPSIFTVLTVQSHTAGTAVADFVIFPPRWAVQKDTFRPPYYHRNCMSEFMGLIKGVYEAKKDGFCPGGATLHSMMTPHGPDKKTFDAASKGSEEPEYIGNAMAFMFESCYQFRLTDFSKKGVDGDYYKCWSGLGELPGAPKAE